MMNIPATESIYTVSQLNQEVRQFLENHISSIWISGEISNFACPSSGHWYFTLKDASASVRCAFFQPHLRGIRFRPQNGMQVLVHAKVSLYEARGEFQLIADFIEPAGDGILQKAFNALKERLQAEGLFAADYKKALPIFPQTIGVITSPTGAAIQDIINVITRRFPALQIIIYPCAVQGQLAAAEIVNAIQAANSRNECDVLIIGRGGGSLEDLWPFNEENVARAIFASKIPTISAVGHEIDFTIADFVADVRAPTPSAAAELITPDQFELLQRLKQIQQTILTLFQYQLTHKQQQLLHITKRLRHPKQRLQDQSQQLDQLEQRLQRSWQSLMQLKQQQFVALSRALHTISPLATLDRGYALIQDSQTQQVISSVESITIGDPLLARLKDGQLHCKVEKIASLPK